MVQLDGSFNKATEISAWLKAKGYKYEEDYNWTRNYKTQQLIFSCKDPKLETLLLLQWA